MKVFHPCIAIESQLRQLGTHVMRQNSFGILLVALSSTKVVDLDHSGALLPSAQADAANEIQAVHILTIPPWYVILTILRSDSQIAVRARWKLDKRQERQRLC